MQSFRNFLKGFPQQVTWLDLAHIFQISLTLLEKQLMYWLVVKLQEVIVEFLSYFLGIVCYQLPLFNVDVI